MLSKRWYLSILALSLTTTTILATYATKLRFQNIVLEGGGMKGLSYVGAARALQDEGYYRDGRYAFERIAGTSVGCLFGFILALDISPSDMEKLVRETDFDDLFSDEVHYLLDVPRHKDRFYFKYLNYLGYTFDVLRYIYHVLTAWLNNQNPGLTDKDPILDWLFEQVIPLSRYEIDRNTTFAEFARMTNHQLTCFATRLLGSRIMRFNDLETPNVTVLDGLYASISLPFIFKPIHDESGDPLIDGGLLNNFPVYEFDTPGVRSETTLGMSLYADIRDPLPRHEPQSTIETALDDLRIPNGASSFVRNREFAATYTLDKRIEKMILDSKYLSNLQICVNFTTTTNDDTNNPDDQLEREKPVKKHRFMTILAFARQILKIMIDSKDVLTYAYNPRNHDRLVFLDSPLRTLELNPSVERIDLAIHRGYLQTMKFFERLSRDE